MDSISEYNLRQRKYFENAAKPNMRPLGSFYLRRQIEKTLHFGRITRQDRILEVGCGMGRYTLLLAEQGYKVEGMDLSPILLDRLKGYGAGHFSIPLHCADLHQIPDEFKEKYDVVLGFFTLHHLMDIEKCFHNMAHILKPGGKIIFLEPNPYNFLFYLQMLVTPEMTWQGDKGMLRMRKKVIFNAMRKAGFANLKMDRFGFFPPFVVNRPFGQILEPKLEKIILWKSFLPFQLFGGIRG
jgi:SAM-dependent methyltransferase